MVIIEIIYDIDFKSDIITSRIGDCGSSLHDFLVGFICNVFKHLAVLNVIAFRFYPQIPDSKYIGKAMKIILSLTWN